MNKKIIITILAAALAGTLGVTAAFASQVTGTLSSSGVTTTQNQNTGQDTNGTLTGSIVGGSTGATTSGGGGGTVASGGGGHPLPASTSTGASTISSGGTSIAGSENGGMNGTVIAATPSDSFQALAADTGAPTNSPDVSAPAPSDQLAFADGAATPSAGIPLAANAGGTPIGVKIGWTLLALLILIAIGYGVSRTYGNKTTGTNGPTPKP